MPTTAEIHWLAGIIEGEGNPGTWVHRRSGGTYHYPRIQMIMTDEDVVARVAALTEAKMYGPYTSKRKTPGKPYKPYWQLCILGDHAVAWMLTLYPLMGLRRRQQIWTAVMRWRYRTAAGKPRSQQLLNAA